MIIFQNENTPKPIDLSKSSIELLLKKKEFVLSCERSDAPIAHEGMMLYLYRIQYQNSAGQPTKVGWYHADPERPNRFTKADLGNMSLEELSAIGEF
jgi:hypothetical protein